MSKEHTLNEINTNAVIDVRIKQLLSYDRDEVYDVIC